MTNQSVILALLILTGFSMFFQGLWCVWGQHRDRNGMGIGYPVFITAMAVGILCLALHFVLGFVGLQKLDTSSIFYLIVQLAILVAFNHRESTRKLDPFFSLLLTLIGVALVLVGLASLCISFTAMQNTNLYITLG